jgi:membrane protein implicated in regulation of membrane protease activity
VAQYTAVALAYNFAAAAFGGTAPLVASALCRTSFPTAPGWYISAVAVVSLVVIAVSRRFLGDDGVEHKRRERMAKEVGVAKPALDLGASTSITRSVNSAIGSAATANHV